ncbi:hypothetical protein J6590_068558, partial [Homalodisca vitripennis]
MSKISTFSCKHLLNARRLDSVNEHCKEHVLLSELSLEFWLVSQDRLQTCLRHYDLLCRTGATLAVTWALMELFWTNEKAAMAARPRPLPPSPPPSHTPRPLLDPLRRPPSQWESSKPPTLRERWRTSDGGRAMADGVMADEQKFVSPAAGIRTRTPTNARLCAWRRDMAVRAARGARRSTGFFHISCSFLALRLRCCYLVETAYNML